MGLQDGVYDKVCGDFFDATVDDMLHMLQRISIRQNGARGHAVIDLFPPRKAYSLR